jgi:hypothetical protein
VRRRFVRVWSWTGALSGRRVPLDRDGRAELRRLWQRLRRGLEVRERQLRPRLPDGSERLRGFLRQDRHGSLPLRRLRQGVRPRATVQELELPLHDQWSDDVRHRLRRHEDVHGSLRRLQPTV